MPESITICIAGATGLVGGELLLILSHLPQVKKIIAVTRTPLGKIPAKTENLILSFDNLEKYSSHMKAEIFICCLGTTIKKAQSRENFFKVDYDYSLEFCKIAEKVGASKLLLVTAMGSSPRSMFFYSRVKGQLEEAVKKLSIPQIEVFRPSLIIGQRKEKRLGEEIAQKMSSLTDAVCIGPLRKYRSINATTIARSMALATLNFNEGHYIYDSQEIQRIADSIQVKFTETQHK